MRTTFHDLKVFCKLPAVVDDMIFMYAYGMTRDIMHLKSARARSVTYNMPVPIAWKTFFLHDYVIGRKSREFDWHKFLQNTDADVICPVAVSETLNLLNWNSMRSKGNAISCFVRTSTKTNLKARLLDKALWQKRKNPER